MMATKEGTIENGKDYRKKKKMDVKTLVEAEIIRKKWVDTSSTGEKG